MSTCTADYDEMILSVPPLLALALFRKELFPQDENEDFPVHVSGKKLEFSKLWIFRYGKMKYDSCVFANGSFEGTPEEGFEVGAMYLKNG